MVNMAKALIKFFFPCSSKFILIGVTCDQYDALARMICSLRPVDLQNHLRYMSRSEAYRLVNLANIRGITLLMEAVYFSNSNKLLFNGLLNSILTNHLKLVQKWLSCL